MELVTTRGEQLLQACCDSTESEDILDMENSLITGDGLKEATSDEQKTVVFHAKTKQSEQYTGKLNLTAELVHMKSKDRVECEVVKQQNSQHKISYRPVKRGKHELQLTVNGNPARGSPFQIAVTPSLLSFSKPVRVVQTVKYPKGNVLNSKGQMIVVEFGWHIYVLTPDGEKIKTYGKYGSRKGELKSVCGVTVDSDDNIYVTDNGQHCILKFTSDLEFVATVGGLGKGTLEFLYPIGICYNHKDNLLYVADSSNNRIQVLTTNLNFVRSLADTVLEMGSLKIQEN